MMRRDEGCSLRYCSQHCVSPRLGRGVQGSGIAMDPAVKPRGDNDSEVAILVTNFIDEVLV